MMHQFSIIFSVLSIFCFSVLSAPLPFDRALGKRQTQSGRGTWFYDGEGACGDWNTDSDSIVAISAEIYGTGQYCNRWVQVTNTDNEQMAYGLMRDRCQGCGASDLDMSIGLFQQLGQLSTGVLPIDWELMPTGWSP